MRSLHRSTTALAALGAAAVLVGACADEEDEAPAQPKLAPASAIEADAYAITCGHVRDQQQWAHLTRQGHVRHRRSRTVPQAHRLIASQSVYYALTEVCKQKPATFEPARAAADGVRDGTFRVQRPDHSRATAGS